MAPKLHWLPESNCSINCSAPMQLELIKPDRGANVEFWLDGDRNQVISKRCVGRLWSCNQRAAIKEYFSCVHLERATFKSQFEEAPLKPITEMKAGWETTLSVRFIFRPKFLTKSGAFKINTNYGPPVKMMRKTIDLLSTLRSFVQQFSMVLHGVIWCCIWRTGKLPRSAYCNFYVLIFYLWMMLVVTMMMMERQSNVPLSTLRANDCVTTFAVAPSPRNNSSRMTKDIDIHSLQKWKLQFHRQTILLNWNVTYPTCIRAWRDRG